MQWSKHIKKEMDANEVTDESLNAVLVLGDCGGQQYNTPVKSLNRKAFKHHAQTVTSFHEHFTLKKNTEKGSWEGSSVCKSIVQA